MAKLIYIISDSFSGSTLLDIVCGTVPGVFSMGEIVFLPWELHRDRNESNPCPEGWCSCLKKYSCCPTWTKILAALKDRLGYDVYQNPYRFQIGFLPRRRDHRFEMPGEIIFRHMLFPFLQRKSSFSLANRLIAAKYRWTADNSWILFDTIAETYGVTHVVDSTKCPVRMNLLRDIRPSDISVILLVRDVRGVAHSCKKRGKDPVAAARQWTIFYQCTLRILERSKQSYLLIRYEDLARDPLSERQRIATFIGKSNVDGQIDVDTRDHHLVGGNSMRYKGKLQIKPSEDWRDELPANLKQTILQTAEKLFQNYPVLKYSSR